jgi:hypothetical protein
MFKMHGALSFIYIILFHNPLESSDFVVSSEELKGTNSAPIAASYA